MTGLFILFGQFFSSYGSRSKLFINMVTEKDSETEYYLNCSNLHSIIYPSLFSPPESIHHRLTIDP